MTEVWVVVLTAAPALAGAALGYRFGLRRLLMGFVPWILSWGAGVLTAFAAVRLNQVEPFGLITPLVWGVGAVCLTGVGIRLLAPRSAFPRPSAAGRVAGSFLGMGSGLIVACAAWLALGFSQVAAAAVKPAVPAGKPPVAGVKPAPASWGQELFKVANRGFLRHLPGIGSVSNETEATIAVLRSDPRDRAALAREKGWDRLAELPTLQALLDDPDVLADLDAFAGGDVTALYRLQKRDRIIAFYEEEPIQRMIPDLRPSTIARELEEIGRYGRLDGRPSRLDGRRR